MDHPHIDRHLKKRLNFFHVGGNRSAHGNMDLEAENQFQVYKH